MTPIPDDMADAMQGGEIPWDYDRDMWRAEQEWDDQMQAADMRRKEGSHE